MRKPTLIASIASFALLSAWTYGMFQPAPITYTVKVWTTKNGTVINNKRINDAGTDARVFMTLTNTAGAKSAELELDTPDDDFNNGEVTQVDVSYTELFELASVTLRHDNSGDGPGWHVAYVEITAHSPQGNFIYRADFNRWIATSEDDRQLFATRPLRRIN